MSGKLRSRKSTDKILIVLRDIEDITFEELKEKAKRDGYLFFPHHFYIDREGTIHNPRDKQSVASGEFEGYESTLTILISRTQTAKQKVALAKLVEELNEEYSKEDEGITYEENTR